jgi:hypothetical protein
MAEAVASFRCGINIKLLNNKIRRPEWKHPSPSLLLFSSEIGRQVSQTFRINVIQYSTKAVVFFYVGQYSKQYESYAAFVSLANNLQ